MKNLEYISISSIKDEGRHRLDLGNIQELMESIKTLGLISPIAVRDDRDGTYTLIAGGRRLEAFRRLAVEPEIGSLYETIPVKIFKHDMTEIELRESELAENMIRKDMTWAEEVVLKRKIHEMMVEKYGEKIGKTEDAPGWDSVKTAKILNSSTSTISRDLQLATAVEKFPDLSKAKNKSEALQILNKARSNYSNSELEKKMQTIQTNENDKMYHKKKLCDSYVVADCFEKLPSLPDSYFDLIEVDPPYGINFKNQDRSPNRIKTSAEYNEIDEEEYPDFLNKLMAICFKKVKPTGWVLFWHSHSWYPVVSQSAKSEGFLSYTFPGFWVKTAATNMNPTHNLARNYEPFLYLRRGAAKIEKLGTLSTFSSAPLRVDRIHPTERPIDLMEEIISTFIPTNLNKKILVPFAGSGNTLLAACNLGHSAIGYDLTSEYRNGFVSRVMEGTYGAYKSKRGEKKGEES